MPIDGAFNPLARMMHISRSERAHSAGADDNAPPARPAESLARLTDRISLSAVDPAVRRQLEAIAEQGGSLAPVLENNISQLQDAFIDGLRSALTSAGLSVDEKVTLQLQDGELAVLGGHPDKHKLDMAVAAVPELKESFTEIKAQAELVRDLNSIQAAVNASGRHERYLAQSSLGGRDFRVSLRGSMSHFYFAG
ncbi:hypothetical protein Dde_1940 [Oleidesulfovibrio alaskensis G20]|uniref:Uncharacterized protein n=1 Tax=Oleidesulfovibrio alaskensis (strain ATCC BAA-1058 / DSM 17464 / G20) TaxID=207559 RepID=Q310A9_OLEA2|nr:hypothetical protein [Oleidesulfovibrio alaskensis]ABB38737.1 hypothetical protein Dde_1940 [Oleidesulfovibrio alaskensis G20]MBG0773051.1 hypothetical protein [Oleidesulfovibrio alaskensis]